jgi:hypothetical protein
LAETGQFPICAEAKFIDPQLMGSCGCDLAIQKPDPAFSAGPFSATRKLNSKFMQHIN